MYVYYFFFDYFNFYFDMFVVEFDSIKWELFDQFIEGNIWDSGSSVVMLFKFILNIGFVFEEIVRMLKGYDLIIMGIIGEGNFLEKVFGSVFIYVVCFVYCLVLFVFGNCKCGNFEEVVYVSNYQVVDEVMVKKLFIIIGFEINNIYFVYIDNEIKLFYYVEQVLYEQVQLYGIVAIGFNLVEIECFNVQEGIV